MRGEVPIKYVLKGDREAGKLFMRRGAVLMGMLEHGMTYRGLKQSVMRRWVRPDVLIECDCRFGLRTVTITVPPVIMPETTGGGEDRGSGVVVAVFCSSGLFLHHGNWKVSEFSRGVLQYGYHLEIPDNYVFADFSLGATSVIVHWWNASWAYWPGGATLATIPKPYEPARIFTGFSRFLSTVPSGAEERTDDRFAWNAPVVMPGLDPKNYLLAYNIRYAADDPRIQFLHPSTNGLYTESDFLRLTEVTLQMLNEDGRQPLSTKWIFAQRGGAGNQGKGSGIVYRVEPMPERNGVRRYMATPYDAFRSNAVFIHVSFRDRYDRPRIFSLTIDMLAPLFPDEYHYDTRRDRAFMNITSYMDAAGKIHVMGIYRGESQRDDSRDDNYDLATIQWTVALVFITLPALPDVAMTEEEEVAFIRDNMTLQAIPWTDFLPLLEVLHSETPDVLRSLPGGRGSYDGAAVLLRFEINDYVAWNKGYPWTSSRVQYTLDGVTYNPGRREWNLEPVEDPEEWDTGPYAIDIWGADYVGGRRYYGIFVERIAAMEILGQCVYDSGLPIDSAVFHSGGEHEWFSWTRMWGGLSINPVTGMRRIQMTWPPEIATNGVKPITTWAGNGLYCCVCFDTCTRRVANVYIGTPFNSDERDAWWTKLPLVSDEWRAVAGNGIMHIRPALVTTARVVLLAVVKVGAVYRAAYCDAPPSKAALRFCGVIPLGAEAEIGDSDRNFMSLDICDCGGEFSDLLKTYPSPPRAIDAKAYSAEYKYQDWRFANTVHVFEEKLGWWV